MYLIFKMGCGTVSSVVLGSIMNVLTITVFLFQPILGFFIS